MEILIEIVSSRLLLAILLIQAAIAVAILLYDIAKNNSAMPGLMKWVWGFSVAYSGLFGLAIYWISGRPGISDDAKWRRGFRSTAHCYSGCGMGEISGMVIAVGLLSLDTVWVVVVTFSLAYVAGFALTMGPMMQEGADAKTAFKDALYSETASITVMEIVAISVDLWLAGEAGMGEAQFWNALIISLTCGFVAAWPVNYVLIRMVVKSGMGDPREYGQSA